MIIDHSRDKKALSVISITSECN